MLKNLLFVSIILIVISFSNVKSQNNFSEERVRYILADITLGNVAGFYRSHNSPNDIEAIKRWDNGVRVLNIKSFDRVIVGNKGWQIVYTGTTRSIDGMDVKLNTDVQYSEERVRYILVDITLGNVAGFYRSHNSPNDIEAIRRWDSGVRIENIRSFDRVIVGNKGWQIVYTGTTRSIDGMDVRLNTDRR